MKKLNAASLVLLALPMLCAADNPNWGLAERRALKAFQDNKLAQLQQEIVTAAGTNVELQIDWDNIALVGDADRYNDDDYWVNIFFVPTTNALRSLTSDEMGKQAVASKLKKIVFTYNEDTAPLSNYTEGIIFDDGTLTINFRPYANVADTDERAKAIVSTLEPKL